MGVYEIPAQNPTDHIFARTMTNEALAKETKRGPRVTAVQQMVLSHSSFPTSTHVLQKIRLVLLSSFDVYDTSDKSDEEDGAANYIGWYEGDRFDGGWYNYHY